jgi:hypothetical protein
MQDRIKEWIERSCALGFVGEPATKALEHSRAFALVLRKKDKKTDKITKKGKRE